jgi:hypothetical protein
MAATHNRVAMRVISIFIHSTSWHRIVMNSSLTMPAAGRENLNLA